LGEVEVWVKYDSMKGRSTVLLKSWIVEGSGTGLAERGQSLEMWNLVVDVDHGALSQGGQSLVRGLGGIHTNAHL